MRSAAAPLLALLLVGCGTATGTGTRGGTVGATPTPTAATYIDPSSSACPTSCVRGLGVEGTATPGLPAPTVVAGMLVLSAQQDGDAARVPKGTTIVVNLAGTAGKQLGTYSWTSVSSSNARVLGRTVDTLRNGSADAHFIARKSGSAQLEASFNPNGCTGPDVTACGLPSMRWSVTVTVTA